MGVPKFFRYISERYPCLSEVVKEHQIPEFDNLYLDMNGIIHVCSHPNDNDPHFRISEEAIFSDIFHYIEILFRMIQPKRLFFMAVDGVAPRAKMNQQRGRRFRSVKDMEMQEAKAAANNQVLPNTERFDSNCITPGTVFMARLHAQLRYFVNYKISTDKLWQKPTVILSGHETPGEGEHKIMDYIRFMKSQPSYDPNTRHCLYGLDADLIMLGLCTHEPHFALLREEVKFGRSSKDKERASVPEEIRFYLLHLSLMREYLDLEFQDLKTTVPFEYNLENIIDDWVMMGFLVGNDFIPHLPYLHIANGALPELYKAYMEVLPLLGGYINEGGTLNLPRFQKYMEKLAEFEMSQFKETFADLKYFQEKTGRRPNEKERTSYKTFNNEKNGKSEEQVPLQSVNNDELAALIQSTNDMMMDDSDQVDNEDIYYSSTDEEDDNSMMIAEFYQHKNHYYVNKLEYEKVTPSVLRSQAEGYVRAIQWNLNYYYNGCCSWSWFYPHHYAPFISDITNFEDLKLEFEIGEPFLPFQQLLAVLPAGSKKLLPEPFQELMINEDSPIIDFYPTDFKTDMNGKKQEWEAVVLIPFINQESLLKAMATKHDRLTDEEKRRNSHGPMLVYNYTPDNQGAYEAPEYYPTLNKCYAKEMSLYREEIFVEQSKLVKGLCPGVRLDVYYAGFPTLRHLQFTASLRKAKVKVFDNLSRGENMILKLKEHSEYKGDLLTVAMKILDKSVFVNWPHLMEAKVVAVANVSKRIMMKQCTDGSNTMVTEDLSQDFIQQWKLSKKSIEDMYFSKLGVDCNNTEVIVYARNLEGWKHVFINTGRVSYEKKWTNIPSAYALQTLVSNISAKEPDYNEDLTIDDLFKPSTICFTLGTPHYGAIGTVCDGGKNGRVKLNVCITPEPDLEPAIITAQRCRSSYIPGHVMAQRLGISSHLLSRITGSIFVVDTEPGNSTENHQKTNIGLNLKFTKKNEEVCGYTKKSNKQWLYSSKAERLINDYMRKVPEVITYIASNANNDIYHMSELFPSPENSAELLKKLTLWLNDQDFMKAERMSCGSEILETEVVNIIEKIIDSSKNKNVKTVVMQIKPHLLLLPKTNVTGLGPDTNAIHKLFDRIVCIRESFTVPLGLKGTIIGIQNAEKEDDVIYDVVFDKEFVGGIKIRCSQNRGYRMTRKGFLNLSHGVRLENSKLKNNPSMTFQQSEYDRVDTAGWNNPRNSAFASCNKNNYQQYNSQHEQLPAQQPFQRQDIHVADNFLPKFSSSQQKDSSRADSGADSGHSNKLTSEFEAMWNELKKAGARPPSQDDQDTPPSADASDVLKKMLKIAYNGSPKRKNNSSSVQSSGEDVWVADKNVGEGYCHDESSVKQLEEYLKQRAADDPVYSYDYNIVNGKSLVTAKIYFELPEEEPVGRPFSGKPSADIKSAAESAALTALNILKLEHGFKIKSAEKSEQETSAESNNSNSDAINVDLATCTTTPTGTTTCASIPRRPLYHPVNVVGAQNTKVTPAQPPPLMGYGNSGRQPNNYHHVQQQYWNSSGGVNSSSSHGMNKTNFNWYHNPDLPTPPQQWYQNNRHLHPNNDSRHSEWKQRLDHQGVGGAGKYHQQHYYGSGSHHQSHHGLQPPVFKSYSSYQQQSYGQNSNCPSNLKQIRPIPPMVGQMPFIPLQAITQCRTRPSSCSNFISKNIPETNQLQLQQHQNSSKSVLDSSNTGSSQSSNHQSRPQTAMSQPRKSRIAAKFNVKIE